MDGWLKEMLRKHAPDSAAMSRVRDRAAKLEQLLRNDPETGVLQVLVGGSLGKRTANARIHNRDAAGAREAFESAWEPPE